MLNLNTMKRLLTVLMLVMAHGLFAQSAADSAGIRKACADYVEGFFTQDVERMKGGLHPQLVKRIIDNRTGKAVIANTSRDELASYLKPEYKMKDPNPSEPLKTTVVIYDIASDIAMAKITTNKMTMFFDYVQLGKIDGTWQVINVLWAYFRR